MNSKTFIITETGNNLYGFIHFAYKLIDAAKDARDDALNFNFSKRKVLSTKCSEIIY